MGAVRPDPAASSASRSRQGMDWLRSSYQHWRAHPAVLSLWAALVLAAVLQDVLPQSAASDVLMFIMWPLSIVCSVATLLVARERH